MSITALSGTDASSAVANGVTSVKSEDQEQRFLKLLVTQLNNQDPLNPMENAELTSQLAQMSTVSGIEKMNATLKQMVEQSNSGQLLQASALVGRGVLVPGDQVVGGGGAGSGFGLELPASAQSAQAVIYDSTGLAVRTMELGAMPAGANLQVWDGKNDAGDDLPAGVYRVAVSATNGSAQVPATALTLNQVTSVSQSGAVTSLELDTGRNISLSDVRRVG